MKHGANMAQDTEEALRVILMIGNAVIPASRDIIRLLARVSATVGRTGWKGGKLVAGAAMDRIDGMGTKGMVRNTAKMKGAVQTIDVTDRLDRADLHEMAALCRKLGVAFSVSDIVSDGKAEHTLIQFAAQDASTIQAVLQVALDYRIVNEADLDEACSTPALSDAPLAHGGRTWASDGQALRTEFRDAAGQPMTAIARPDGSWEIADVTGKTALHAGAELKGAADPGLGADLGAALTAVSARIGAMADPGIARANAKLATSPQRMKSMSAADVARSAARAVERKKSAGTRAITPKPGIPLPKAPHHPGKR